MQAAPDDVLDENVVDGDRNFGALTGFALDRRPSVPPQSACDEHRRSTWASIVGDRVEAPVSLVAVIVVGIFAGVVAISAFILSFFMIYPVVVAAGWPPDFAWLGPIVVDITAVAAAFMSVLSKHYVFVRTGRFLLFCATLLSITLNLAGHQMHELAPNALAGLRVPAGWAWATALFSVLVPVVLAVIIHLFGSALHIFMEQRERAERERREAAEAAERARAEEEQREQSRQARLEELARNAGGNVAVRPKRKGERPTKQVALALGLRNQATTPASLRTVLTEHGWGVTEVDDSTVKRWARDIRDAVPAA